MTFFQKVVKIIGISKIRWNIQRAAVCWKAVIAEFLNSPLSGQLNDEQ